MRILARLACFAVHIDRALTSRLNLENVQLSVNVDFQLGRESNFFSFHKL